MVDKSQAPIALQEPLIIERLRIAFPASIFTIDRVPMAMTITEFDTLSRRAPAIGLAWIGMKSDKSARNLAGTQQWRLYLIHRATSSLQARFKGDVKGLGLDAMVDVSALILHGCTLKGVGSISVTGANAIIADGLRDDAVALAQIDFEFSFCSNPNELDIEDGDDLTAIGVTWSLADAPEGAPSQTDTINMGA